MTTHTSNNSDHNTNPFIDAQERMGGYDTGTYTDTIIDENADEGIIQRQVGDLSNNSYYEKDRQIASIPLDLYKDSDICQGMKKSYDWATSVTRPSAYTAASYSLYTAAHAMSNQDNTELNEALRETLRKDYTSFDQVESISFDELKKRLGKTIGEGNADGLTLAALEGALKTGYINIVENGDTVSHELTFEQLSSINAYFHINDNIDKSCKNGIDEIKEALERLGYDVKTFNKLDEKHLKELVQTGSTQLSGRRKIQINHLTNGKNGEKKKSCDAVLVENYVRTKKVRNAIKQKEQCRIKTTIKGKQWINKAFNDADVYQGYLKTKNAYFAVKSACVASMYIKHYTQHCVEEKVIKKAENAFLKIDLGLHNNSSTGYEHTTKFVNRKEKILDKQQKRSDRFESRQKKIQKRRERKRMSTVQKIKTSAPANHIKSSVVGQTATKASQKIQRGAAHKYGKFKSKHRIMGKVATGIEKTRSAFKAISGHLLDKLGALKGAILKACVLFLLVLIVYMGLVLLVNMIVVFVSAPSTLLDNDESGTGQRTVTALLEHEEDYIEEAMDPTKYTYTETCPYDSSQTISVDKVELKQFVNERGELISDIGIYKEIFTLASRHFENDPDVDPDEFENYCIALWDATHEKVIEYEEYEHAVENDGEEACSNWQTYTHESLSGSEDNWYDGSTGEQCTNFSQHSVQVSDTAESWWASCLGHERCFGHLKATVTIVVTTDLDELMAIDPQRDPSGEWEGWTEDNIELAKIMYDQDWSDFDITFPGSASGMLTASEVTDLINQLTADYLNGNGTTLSPTRLAVVQEALNRIGQYKYVYGGNHSASSVNGNGSDCSGFVGQVLYQSGGYQGFGESWGGASSFLNIGTQISPDQIQPGDIIIKNGAAGGVTSSSNHIVIYVGVINGEPMVAECTTYHGVSGSQLNPLSKVAHYEYWIHMNY